MPVDRARMKAQLELHEARRRKVYADSKGNPTGGVGHHFAIGSTLSDRVIDALLDDDIYIAESELLAALPWVTKLSEVRQRVLVDMAFNMGVPTLLTFKQTLAAIERGDFWMAARGMEHSRWADDVGDGPGGVFDRAERLVKMMETGVDYSA